MKKTLKIATNNKSIEIVDSIFTDQELKFIDDYCSNELGEQSESNCVNWDKRLIDGISGDIRITKTAPLLDPVFHDLVVRKCNEAFSIHITDCMILLYEGQEKSGINWHNDGDRKAAISIYLTENWDRDYGGLFSFDINEDGSDIYTSVLPKRNRAIIQQGGVEHGVTSVTDNAPIRKSLQIWVYEKE